jgi:hypothetical protein
MSGAGGGDGWPTLHAPHGVHDLAEQIWHAGGDLHGGEINFLGRLAEIVPANPGYYLLGFDVQDNDTDEAYTALTVATRQPMPELQALETEEAALFSIKVHEIGQPKDLLKDHTILVRPVLGWATLQTRLGDTMPPDRCTFIGPPTSALVTFTLNAKRQKVHTHLICVRHDDMERKVSREEKLRRIEALRADIIAGRKQPDRALIDGGHRTLTLQRMLH